MKASRFLTHMKKLKDPEEPLDRLFSRMRRARASPRPGAVSASAWLEALDRDRLEHFLQALPRASVTSWSFGIPVGTLMM